MKEAVVIGAGFAGLSAASFLVTAGYKVSVLEKHDRLGWSMQSMGARRF